MPRCILKLGNKYCEWSTFVDAPVTDFYSLDKFKEHIRREHGEAGLRELPRRLERVEETGTSFYGVTAAEVIAGNRAGPNEETLTEAEILERFTEPFGIAE